MNSISVRLLATEKLKVQKAPKILAFGRKITDLNGIYSALQSSLSSNVSVVPHVTRTTEIPTLVADQLNYIRRPIFPRALQLLIKLKELQFDCLKNTSVSP